MIGGLNTELKNSTNCDLSGYCMVNITGEVSVARSKFGILLQLQAIAVTVKFLSVYIAIL